MDSPERPAVSFAAPNPYWFLQPEVMKLYFSGAGMLGWVVPHSCDVGPLVLPPVAVTASPPPFHWCHTVSSLPWLPISALPTHLNEYFFFKSLAVQLPYSSIFWQFWLFLVLTLVVILFMAVWEGNEYLPMPPCCSEIFKYFYHPKINTLPLVITCSTVPSHS